MGAGQKAFLGAVGLMTGFGVLVAITLHDHSLDKTPPVAESAPPATVAVVTQDDIPITVSGIGTVQALNTVTVRTRVDGQLLRVLFAEGQLVRKGDLLAEIDPRPFQAALNQAKAKLAQDQAALDNAKTILARDSDLAAKQFVSQQALDTQRSTVQQLQAVVAQDQAAIANAETQLSYTSITSPIDGLTGIRLVDPGNIVHAADATGIVVVTQIQPVTVISTLPEQQLARVRGALKTGPVKVAALSRTSAWQRDEGTLGLLDNQIDPTSGTIRLKSTFPNKDGALWPGQFVLLQVTTSTARQATYVPSSALQRGPRGFFVYVVGPNDVAEARPVEVGQVAENRAIIESGLAPGDRVVTAGQYRIAPGMAVSITSASPTVARKDK